MQRVYWVVLLTVYLAVNSLWAQGTDSFSQGVGFFKAQQYAQAIAAFQQAIQQDPHNAKAYWCMGVAQFMTGDKKGAVLSLTISNNLSPNPSVLTYANQLKATLPPADQQWVDSNLAPAVPATAKAPTPSPTKSTEPVFGLRLEPGIGVLALGDQNTTDKTLLAQAAVSQETDSTYQYNYSIPAMDFEGTIEPTLKLFPDLEIGIPLSYLTVGTWTLTESSTANNYNDVANVNMSAFCFGVNARWFLNQGSLRFFLAGGPLAGPVNFNFVSTDTSGGSIVNNINTTSWGFGGQAQLGADLDLGGGLLASVYGGYRYFCASNFSGSDVTSESGSTASTPAEFYYVQTPQGEQIYVGAPNTNYSNARPMNVDLSAILGGVEVSAYF